MATGKQIIPILALTLVTAASAGQPAEHFDRLPLSFEAGPSPNSFVGRTPHYRWLVTPTTAVLATREHQLRLQWVGANPAAAAAGSDRLPGVANYYLGNDPAHWRVGVALVGRVQYANIYPGVDLVYYGNQRELQHDFIVHPGACPDQIRLAASGPFHIAADGSLVTGHLRLSPPVIYQDVDGIRREIAGAFCLDEAGQAGFTVGDYDTSRELVIDPVLIFSTYLGGSGQDLGQSIAVHTNGHVYVAGYTESADFPSATGSLGGTRDAYVAKLNATGTALLFATYLGGSGIEQGHGLALDKDGNAYVGGITQSANFPTTAAALDSTLGGTADAFVVKLSETGALVYSTYLGGSGDENNVFALGGVAVNAAGNAFVAGITTSTDFPTTSGAHKQFLSGPSDAFVVKLNPAGTGLVYGTYLGGSSYDGAYGVAVDGAEAAYVADLTRSSNFPTTTGAYDRTFGGGSCYSTMVPCADAFVAKLNAAGSALVYSTFLGGASEDNGCAIAVDTKGNAYLTGDTASMDFPTTPGAFSRTNGGLGDAFVAKLNSNGTTLVYSTYLGGVSGSDGGYAIAVDAHQCAYVAGEARSWAFPVTPDALNTNVTGGFLTKVNVGGTDLEYSTFLGDGAYGIALDTAANIYVTGYTDATNFPTTDGAFRTTRQGYRDSFVTQFANIPSPPQADLQLTKTGPTGDAAINFPIAYTLVVTNLGPDPATAVVVTDNLPATTAFLSAVPSQGNCQINGNTLTCQLGQLTSAATVTLQLSAGSEGLLTNTAAVAATEPDPDPANNSATVVTSVTRPNHDLAVIRLKAPKMITLKPGVSPNPRKLRISIQNVGTFPESIADADALENLLNLAIESLGDCAVPEVTLISPTTFPVVLAPKKKLRIACTVAIVCPNDPLPSSKTENHADYRYTVALDSSTDIQPANNTCPRPPSATDKGCAKGLDVLTDVIVK